MPINSLPEASLATQARMQLRIGKLTPRCYTSWTDADSGLAFTWLRTLRSGHGRKSMPPLGGTHEYWPLETCSLAGAASGFLLKLGVEE